MSVDNNIKNFRCDVFYFSYFIKHFATFLRLRLRNSFFLLPFRRLLTNSWHDIWRRFCFYSVCERNCVWKRKVNKNNFTEKKAFVEACEWKVFFLLPSTKPVNRVEYQGYSQNSRPLKWIDKTDELLSFWYDNKVNRHSIFCVKDFSFPYHCYGSVRYVCDGQHTASRRNRGILYV